MATEAWRSFLKTVDEDEPEESVSQEAENWLFTKTTRASPGGAAGCTTEVIRGTDGFSALL